MPHRLHCFWRDALIFGRTRLACKHFGPFFVERNQFIRNSMAFLLICGIGRRSQSALSTLLNVPATDKWPEHQLSLDPSAPWKASILDSKYPSYYSYGVHKSVHCTLRTLIPSLPDIHPLASLGTVCMAGIPGYKDVILVLCKSLAYSLADLVACVPINVWKF